MSDDKHDKKAAELLDLDTGIYGPAGQRTIVLDPFVFELYYVYSRLAIE